MKYDIYYAPLLKHFLLFWILSRLNFLLQIYFYWGTSANLSKLDQTCPNWIKLVQIGSDLSKMDQTCFFLWNLIKKCTFFLFFYGSLCLRFRCLCVNGILGLLLLCGINNLILRKKKLRFLEVFAAPHWSAILSKISIDFKFTMLISFTCKSIEIETHDFDLSLDSLKNDEKYDLHLELVAYCS